MTQENNTPKQPKKREEEELEFKIPKKELKKLLLKASTLSDKEFSVFTDNVFSKISEREKEIKQYSEEILNTIRELKNEPNLEKEKKDFFERVEALLVNFLKEFKLEEEKEKAETEKESERKIEVNEEIFLKKLFHLFGNSYLTTQEIKAFLRELKKFQLELKIKGRAFIPNEIKTITDKVFKTQLTKRHFKGEKEIKDLKLVGQDEPVDLGLSVVWQSGNIECFIRKTDFIKLKQQAPKIYVSQDKNIKLLLALVEMQQRNKPDEEKRAEASFTFKEYAKLRGYTDEEIKKGGKFLEELKRDLLSGAYAVYKINEITINGKKYIAHGIPNFYTLFQPKNPKGKWQVKFNSFYAESILKLLRGQAGQYFTCYLKEIADRKTTEKPYLHLFYNQLVYRRQEGKSTIPKKVLNLLKEMGVAEKVLERPKRCFEVLKECLVYISSHYPEELEGVCFYKNPHKQKEKSLSLSHLKALKDFDYKDFKDLLKKTIGLEDIREAFISFIRQSETKKELPAPKPQEARNNSELIKEILEWLDRNINWDKMTKITRAGTENFLKECLNQLGYDLLKDLYQQEAQKTYPNAVDFITKTLPEILKKEKERKRKTEEGLKSIAEIIKNKFLNNQ